MLRRMTDSRSLLCVWNSGGRTARKITLRGEQARRGTSVTGLRALRFCALRVVASKSSEAGAFQRCSDPGREGLLKAKIKFSMGLGCGYPP